VLLVSLLVLVVVRLLLDNVAFDVDVEHQVVSIRLNLEGAVLEVELAQVVRSLGVVRVEVLNDLGLLLFSSQLLLINASVEVVVLNVKVLIGVLVTDLLDDLLLLL
jgi:hypothetical protein